MSKENVAFKDGGDAASSSSKNHVQFYDPSKESRWTQIGLNFESFKRAPGPTGGQVVAGQLSEADVEKLKADAPMLQQKVKARHMTMIAVGGSIGTGLFVGSGSALHRGGPAGVIIGWLSMAIMLINVVQALGEMAIVFPVSGGFYTLSDRFIDSGFAFAMGWNYVLLWIVTTPLEISVAATTVQYWGDKVPLAALITIFWIALIVLCVFGTLGYAEEEFWSASLKLLVAVMFVFIAIICICGGGPKGGEYASYVGGHLWKDPGAFANGFKGVCAVFVTAAFSFAGTEIIGLAASETPDPRSTMPGTVKAVFWRIAVIYVTTLTLIGLLIPYNEPRLLGGGGSAASPFVIVMDKAHIPGLNHLVNVTVVVSVLSIGLASIFAGSRTLTALAENGYAPKVFSYVDKAGRPTASVVFFIAFCPLAYANLAADGSTIFDWLSAISALSTLITWMSICICHIRFRAAWKAQGHSVEELPFRAMFGVYGSWLGIILIVLVLIAQFYIGLFPIGFEGGSAGRLESFFKAYMAAPIILTFWAIGYLWKQSKPKKISEIDLDTGRKSFLTVEEMRQYRAERRSAPLYIRIFRMLFTN